MKKLMTILLALFFLAGCADATEPVETDDANASFLVGAGKADGSTIEEGSVEAQAILNVVNTSTYDELNAVLDVRAVRNIIMYRSGPDGVLGTGDDRMIDTLRALDEIPYVGPAAFRRLLSHVVDKGLLPDAGRIIHGIQEGSDAALAMLFVANTYSFDELNSFLDVRAVRGITERRERAPFTSLEDLDAVPYMGPTAFGRLLGFVQEAGLIGERELTLRTTELVGDALELSYALSDTDRNYRMSLDAYTVSDRAETADVAEVVRNLHNHYERLRVDSVESRENFLNRRFYNREVAETIEATYGPDFEIAVLEGNFYEGWGEWYVEIVVYHYPEQQLAIALTDEYTWD